MRNLRIKTTLILIATLFPLASFSQEKPVPQLYLFHKGNKWGYLNENGDVAIKPMFQGCSFNAFSDTCCSQYFDSNKYCIVKLNKKYGLIDSTGKFIIKPAYDLLEDGYTDSLYIANKNNKWGVIDIHNNIIFPFVFDNQYFLRGSTIGSGTINSVVYLLDYKTKEMKKTEFNSIDPFFRTNFAAVNVNDKYGFINKKGEIVIQPIYEKADGFNKGLAAVKVDNKWGFIDTLGNFIIQPKYDETYGFDYSYTSWAVVEVNQKYGIIDRSGNYLLEPIYARLNISDSSLLAEAEIIDNRGSPKYGMLNEKGEWVLSPEYEDLFYWDKYVTAMKDDKYGVIELNSKKIIIPFVYDYMDTYDPNGLTLFSQNKRGKTKYGYFNKEGKVVWKEK